MKMKQHKVSIVSQNARGLKSDERLEELFLSMEKRKVFASCIQETWRTGMEILEHGQCKLITGGLGSRSN